MTNTPITRRAKLRGTTSKHPLIVEVLQVGATTCKIRIIGGQHDSKKERFIPRIVLERHYAPVK